MQEASRSTTSSESQPRQPAILVLSFVAIGILFDRYADLNWQIWLAAGVLGLLAWLPLYRMRNEIAASLAVCFFSLALGGLWHHTWWNAYAADNVSAFAQELAEPVRIRARVIREPRWLVAPTPDAFESTPNGIRTRVSLRIESVQSGPRWEPATGTIPLYVDGQLSGFTVGDRIEAIGMLALRSPSHNPGGFDIRKVCRSERELCSLSILQPDAITLLERPGRFVFTKIFSILRQRFDQLIWRSQEPSNAALASGILLGLREQLDESEKLNYLMTGTIHLLSISGLHVGILAGGVLALGSLGVIGRRSALWLTIGFVTFYAGLVEFQPTVSRAAVLIVVWCFARVSGRPGYSFNSLAVAALIVLATNPSQLFQIGAQLSFLAVATLSVTHRYFRARGISDPLDELVRRSRPWPVQTIISTMNYIGRAIAVSALVWLVSLPLVAYQFHIVAPIALIANPFLMVPIAMALFSGFVFLLVGWWLPFAGIAIGAVFEWSLSAIRWIVSISGEVPGAYWWTVGPSLAFVVGFYIVALFIYAYPPTRLPARWSISLTIFGMAAGWFLPASVELRQQRQRTGLDIVFVDVGHGGCALLKLPGGQHAIFDAGSTSSPSYTARTISSMLWREQVFHLDALILSHADLDHYCAVDRLTDLFSVGAIYVPAAMSQQSDSPAGELLRRLKQKGISIRLASAGQSFFAKENCGLQILHPRAGVEYSSDNAGSIVCELAFANRRILLTGDIEREGLDAILEFPSRPRLLAQAPHHGSLNSDPQRFVPWSAAENIIICNEWKSTDEEDLAVFEQSGAMVYLTGRDGAIRLRLADSNDAGEIRTWTARPW